MPRRWLLATALATAAGGLLGAAIQQLMTFEIVAVDAGMPLAVKTLIVVVAVGGMGLMASLLVGAPADWAAGRLAPRARWITVPVAAALSVLLFELFVPWGLKLYEIGLLVGLMTVFFGVRAVVLGPGRGKRCSDVARPGRPTGTRS